jgi:acyl-CoA synthetase (AMP-forming)/AMP-acid ligase II
MMEPACLVRWLHDGADHDVVVADAVRTWSRREMVERVWRLARSLGGPPGRRIPVPLPADGHGVARLLACNQAGAVPFVGGSMAVREARWTPPGRLVAAVAPSGSTGRPRWVALADEGVAHVTDCVVGALALRPGEALFCGVPLRHSYGLTQLWACLRARATLVLPRLPLVGRDWEAARGAAIVAGIPPQIGAWAAVGLAPRAFTLAGQATLPHQREQLAAFAPSTDAHLFYGLTEATSRVLALAPALARLPGHQTGTPIAGVRVALVDGELRVAGPNLSPGYFDDPQGSEQRRDGAWLRTGDDFTEHGGSYRFVGRRDGVIKRFGEKVHPEQVEAVLRAVAGVRDAQVSVLDEQLLACIVGEATDAELRRAVRTGMGGHAVPDRIARVDGLARTSAGKLSRAVPPG